MIKFEGTKSQWVQLQSSHILGRCLCLDAETCLDVILQALLEGCKHDLALSRLQAINHRRNGALQISSREQDQLLGRTILVNSRVLLSLRSRLFSQRCSSRTRITSRCRQNSFFFFFFSCYAPTATVHMHSRPLSGMSQIRRAFRARCQPFRHVLPWRPQRQGHRMAESRPMYILERFTGHPDCI